MSFISEKQDGGTKTSKLQDFCKRGKREKFELKKDKHARKNLPKLFDRLASAFVVLETGLVASLKKNLVPKEQLKSCSPSKISRS
jgi:hypothetical protein